MTYLYKALHKPTRLYIKQCPHCGLKYFGKSQRDKIEKYPGSGLRWTKHLTKNNVNPIHLWNSEWYYDTSIVRFATKFSMINKIVKSKKWANLAPENGISGGYLGEEVSKKIGDTVRKIKNDPEWKSTIGKVATEKLSKTLYNVFNEPEWKATIGKERAKKQSDTKQSKEWKETIGEQSNKKHSEIKSNLSWKNTTGVEQARKQSETKQSKEWKEVAGKNRSQKYSDKVNSDEWKQKTYKICESCGKGPMNSSNYTRWHGDNCKHIK